MISLQRALINFANWATRGCVIIDGVIKDVDSINFTCSITVNDVVYYNVPIKVLKGSQASFIEIPKVGSSCLMNFRERNINRPQVFSIHEVDKILVKVGDSTLEIIDGTWTFNGGSLGGMVKISELNDNITSIKNYIEAINTALPIAFTAIGASTAANGANGATSYSNAMSGKLINIKDIENTKIKQ